MKLFIFSFLLLLVMLAASYWFGGCPGALWAGGGVLVGILYGNLCMVEMLARNQTWLAVTENYLSQPILIHV